MDSERLINGPEVTQLVSGGAKIPVLFRPREDSLLPRGLALSEASTGVQWIVF